MLSWFLLVGVTRFLDNPPQRIYSIPDNGNSIPMNWSPIRTLFAERTKHQGESYGPHASSSHKFNENYDTSFVLTCFRFWLLDLSEYVGFLGRVSYGFCKNFDAMTWVCVFIILKH